MDTVCVEMAPATSSGRYDNFHTIDWQREMARDRSRHRSLFKGDRKSTRGWKQQLISWNDAWSGWLCVSLVGIAAGAVAGKFASALTILFI